MRKRLGSILIVLSAALLVPVGVMAEVPNSFDPAEVVTVQFTIGDHSGSHSERWKMVVTGGPVPLYPQSPDYGEVDTMTSKQFRKGKSYNLTVEHIGTHPTYTASTQDETKQIKYRDQSWYGSPSPDFDYQALVNAESAYILIDDNTPKLLGTSGASTTNAAAGKSVQFGFPKPVLSFPDYTEEAVEGEPGVLVFVNDNDSNEDGVIDKDSPFPNDPDYVAMKVKLELEGMTVDEGSVTVRSNLPRVRLWDPDDWSSPLSLPHTWDMADAANAPLQGIGKTVYIEALAPSDTLKDLILSLDYSNSGTTTAEVAVTLLKVDLAVDANRDGTIDFGDAADKTEEDKPYTFWINNDYDSSEGDDPNGSTPNHSDGVINGIRDLEDFTRLHIDVSSILPMLKDDTLDLALKFENTTGNPEIKLWAARDPDGGVGYLEDKAIAEDHLTLGAPGVIGGSTPYVIAQQFWDDLPDGTDTAYLLYEGARVGRGELTLEIQSNGQALGDGPSVWLELRDIKSMYVRGKADWPSSVDYPHEYAYPNVNPPEPNMGYTIDSMGYSFDAPWYETGETIVFVHGWNQPYENSISFGETGFKRLWHRGFTGR